MTSPHAGLTFCSQLKPVYLLNVFVYTSIDQHFVEVTALIGPHFKWLRVYAAIYSENM